MAKIINASQVDNIKDRKILIDTNIWIFIEGLNGQSFRNAQRIYTSAWTILKSKNKIIINEYILAEFCNRSVKMEYDVQKKSSGNPQGFMSYKKFRETDEFKNIVEVTKDTCLTMLEDYEFCSCYDKHYKIKDAIEEFALARLDLTDIIVRSHCSTENYILMSDDSDYASCDIELITGNKRLLETA